MSVFVEGVHPRSTAMRALERARPSTAIKGKKKPFYSCPSDDSIGVIEKACRQSSNISAERDANTTYLQV